MLGIEGDGYKILMLYGDGADALLTDISALSGTVWLMSVHGLRIYKMLFK
jgi:hypothetical protein